MGCKQGKSGDDQARIFGHAVASQRGRSAINNLFEANLAPRGNEYRGDSLFGGGEARCPVPTRAFRRHHSQD